MTRVIFRMVRMDHAPPIALGDCLQENSYKRNRNALTESYVANPVIARIARAKQVVTA